MAFVGIICMTSLSVKIRGGPEIIGATMSAKAWASAGGYCAVRLLKYAPVSSSADVHRFRPVLEVIPVMRQKDMILKNPAHFTASRFAKPTLDNLLFPRHCIGRLFQVAMGSGAKTHLQALDSTGKLKKTVLQACCFGTVQTWNSSKIEWCAQRFRARTRMQLQSGIFAAAG